MKTLIYLVLLIAGVACSLTGCLLVAAGVGAEAGYIAAQDDRTAGETLNDQVIVSAVKTKLLADPDVAGLDINVDSFKGTVRLKGFVNSRNEANKAVTLAQSVSGVRRVKSRLIVD